MKLGRLVYDVIYDSRTGRHRVLDDDVVDPSAGFLFLEVPLDDVASLQVDLRDLAHHLNDDALTARAPWRLRDRLAVGAGRPRGMVLMVSGDVWELARVGAWAWAWRTQSGGWWVVWPADC